MLKLITVCAILAIIFMTEVSSQRIIYPTYRPPPRRPVIIRTARDTERGEPQWLYQGDIPRAPATGDHPYLPQYIDDVKLDPNRRYARSLDSPSSKRYGGGSRSHSNTRDTGATHPGYNRRNARSLNGPSPFNPLPKLPSPNPPPFNPRPGRPLPRFPTYVA